MKPLHSCRQLDKIPDTQADEGDDGRYYVHSRVEIAFILRAIMKSGAPITAYLVPGKDFLVTAILDVDAERGHVVMDSGSNTQLNERVLRGQELTLVSTQDRVKVEFNVERVEAITYESRLAFQIPFPHSLLKLQRREYYRLLTPVLQPPICQIPLPEQGAAGTNKVVEAPVWDISLGGISLIGEYPALKLEAGKILDGCRIVLPDAVTITAKLSVGNSYPMTLRNGTVIQRTGCAFVDLGPNQQAMIQRYIHKLERDRRAKQADPKF